jgi:hypothetical protein
MAMPRHAPLGLLLGAVTLCVSTRGWASPTVRLDYQRAPGLEACPDEPELRNAVRERLGYDPFVADAEQQVVAKLTSAVGELRGEVRLLDASGQARGTRELRAPQHECAELVSRMALAISIAVDPSSLDREASVPTAESDESQADEPQPAPEKAAAPTLRTPVQRRRGRFEQQPRWVLELAVGATIATGSGPRLALGPGLAVGVRRGLASLSLEARYLFMDDLVVVGGHVVSSLAEAALLTCARPALAMICVELSLGRLSVSGEQVMNARTDTALIPRLGPRLGIDLPLMGMLMVRLQAGALFALSRSKVQLAGATVWEAPRLGTLGSLALLGHFP